MLRRFPHLALVGLLVAPGSLVAQGTLQHQIDSLLGTLQARSGFYAKNLPSGRTIAIRADQPMNTLSVIKLAIMIQAFRDAEAGKLDLTTRYQIRPEDRRRGSGLLQTFDVGLTPTYRDLIEQMIITSDNTATDIMIKTVGRDRVNQTLASFGFKETRLRMTTGDLFREVWIRADPKNRSMSDLEVFEKGFPAGPEMGGLSFKLEGDSTRWLGRTTAREMAQLLEGIMTGKYTSQAHADQMIDIMKRQFYTSRLPQRLQWKPVQIAHKTGDWPPIAGNDVGILFYQGGPTIVAVFTNQNRGDFFELEATLGKIAERIVQQWH
jgi:beta-lactamase class A